LNIFPMPEIVIHNIISICRNFLWTGDARRHHSALVAWKTLCLPKACWWEKPLVVALIPIVGDSCSPCGTVVFMIIA
jgi:hypothetical protein